MKGLKILLTSFLILSVIVGFAQSSVMESNPNDMSNGDIEAGRYEEVSGLTGYDDHSTWLADVGSTILIDFDDFASGTQITTQLDPYGISMVSGTSVHGSPGQFVTASSDLPFPMFSPGTLPSEPNFLSNDLSSPVYATGTITFELSSPVTAIGAYVADGAPLGGFGIEVFDGPNSLGFITVPARTLPNSFVGVISTVPFDSATFYAIDEDDSWGLDDVELASGVETGSINGTVTDIAGNPLRAFVIAINVDTQEKYKAITNSDGYYKITDVVPGTYWVICIKKGYKAGIQKVEVEPGVVTPCSFVLKPKLE